MTAPLVVGVPVYNEERYIAETLDSLCAQSYRDFRVLVSDNASTDRTEEICRSIAARDERIVYVRQSGNIGSWRNFRFVLERSRSELFMWLGGHDRLAPRYLERLIGILRAASDVVLAYAQTQRIDENGTPMGAVVRDRYEYRGDGRERLLRFLADVHHCSAIHGVIRREALRDAPFRAIIGSDHLILAHLIYQGRFRQAPEVLFSRREIARAHDKRVQMQKITGRAVHPNYLRLLYEHTADAFRVGEGSTRQRILLAASVARAVNRRRPVVRHVYWLGKARLREWLTSAHRRDR